MKKAIPTTRALAQASLTHNLSETIGLDFMRDILTDAFTNLMQSDEFRHDYTSDRQLMTAQTHAALLQIINDMETQRRVAMC